MSPSRTPPPSRTDRVAPGRRWIGIGAVLWAGLFGIRGIYWALGGTLGLGTLSPELQQAAVERDLAVAAALWMATIALLGGAAVAAALTWPHRLPGCLRRSTLRRVLGSLALVGGGLLTVQGIGYASLPLRVETWTAVVGWYALLWGPWFLLGGVLFVAVGSSALRERSRDHTT